MIQCIYILYHDIYILYVYIKIDMSHMLFVGV
jgi:hypothetical protein